MASGKSNTGAPWKAQCSCSVVFRKFAICKKRLEPTTAAPSKRIDAPKRSENGMVFTFSCSREYFLILCHVLKLRYWLHLGSDNAFVVDWQDVKDNSGEFIEHIIKIVGVDDSAKVHNLYTITLYDTKAKVMVQGNCREERILQEFPKFKSVSGGGGGGRYAREFLDRGVARMFVNPNPI